MAARVGDSPMTARRVCRDRAGRRLSQEVQGTRQGQDGEGTRLTQVDQQLGQGLEEVKPTEQLDNQSKGHPGRFQEWFKNTKGLNFQVLSPLKMPETELEMVPELCPDRDGLDAHGIQSSDQIAKNPGDN
ncbi:hypothetical protein llap_305 [Limosa lapponica baueri]|uniref:Uncharacterized protein n=1 Tax=Limosa lapponica baueri TaxID=1758121 RepID=A0A2I0UTT0_LIMLA|nr:hypothetical protein llap_305 [Limosa lapponica baueri]